MCVLFAQLAACFFVRTHREASEIIADYTVSRIPAAVRSSLSEEQLNAVRKAIVQQSGPGHHKVDIRVTLPLFFRKYYFAFFFGRDRRRSTVNNEKSRIENTPRLVKSILIFGSMSIFFFGLGLTVLTCLYLLKNALGVDLIPGFHLSDLAVYFLTVIDPIR